MGQFKTLLGYEIKKICTRKSTWITFAVLILAYLLTVLLTWSTTYSTVKTREGEEEKWHDSYADRKARERENGMYWSGRKIDNVLLTDVGKEYGKVLEKAGAEKAEVFQREIERFSPIENVLDSLTGGEMLLAKVDGQGNGSLTEEKIYRARKELVKSYQAEYGLSAEERGYRQEKEKLLPKQFTLEYAEGFNELISMSGNGIYMVVLYISFLLAVVVGRVFAEEHQRRADQVILCSRNGKRQLYYAKIMAGILFAVFAATVMLCIVVVLTLFLYGAEGFSAALQLVAGWYSYPLSVGEVLLIMLFISVLVVVLTSILIMVVSEKFCSSVAAMAVVMAVIAGSRLIVIPRGFPVLSQIWNFLPLNLLKLDQGFLDVRLVSVFGRRFTSWQFAPVLYLILGVVLVLLGRRVYCRYQVQGR